MKTKTCIAVLLLLCAYSRLQAQKMLQGKIVNAATREPVAGASVLLETTKQGATADAEGLFKLAVTAPDTLVISHINFITERIAVDPLRSKELVIELQEAGGQQDEVVVIGYGTTTKRFNTGSVSKIGKDVIAQQPVSNVLSAIQGRAAGVFVSTQNGLPGGNISVQVRGQNSIAAGSSPLYVIDGVPFNSKPLNQGFGDLMYANGPISPLNSINPGDIESIEILKDADATAIYGSRGANGVILITTKKGSTGSNGYINIYQGSSQVGHFSPLLNLQQYLMLRNEAFRNDGETPAAWNAPDLVIWDTTQSTDWQQYILGGKANVTNIQAGLSGGNSNTHFLISGNYRHEKSILPGDQYYKRAGAYFNLEHHSSNNRLSINMSAGFTKDKNVLPPPIYSYALLPPNFNSYKADSTLNWSLVTKNPVALLMQQTTSETENMVSDLTIGYRLWDNLTAKVNAGYTHTNLDQFAPKPAASLNPIYRQPNSAVFGENSIISYIAEPQLNYNKVRGRHGITALTGATLQRTVSEGSTIQGIKYANETLMESLSAAGDVGYVSNRFTDYRYTSLFARFNYNYDHKYIANISWRRDGSSRFGPGRRYGNFYAIGGAWLFGEEKWFRQNVPFISSGKLRASYGTTGNDQIADYEYMTAYGAAAAYNGVTTLYPVRIANPDYGWEKTNKLEIAAELGLFKSRVNTTIAWYLNRSDNQLVQYPLPSQTGFTSYQYNMPALVENTGWEFEVHSLNIKNKNFSWETDFNIAIPRNKLVSFPGLATSSFANTYVVGQSLSIIKGYQFLGIDAQTGIPQYEDINKDGALTEPDDFVVIGSQAPRYYGGLNNRIRYKGLSVSVFIQFVQQSGLIPPSLPGFSYSVNSYTAVLDRWQQPGDETAVPVATTSFSNQAWLPVTQLSTSSAVFGEAAYARLKTMDISYNLPAQWLMPLKIHSCMVYVQGQNLFTLAEPGRIDPEMLSTAGGIPALRTIAAGLQVNF